MIQSRIISFFFFFLCFGKIKTVQFTDDNIALQQKMNNSANADD